MTRRSTFVFPAAMALKLRVVYVRCAEDADVAS